MTLDEAIRHAEEVAERYKWFEENYLYNKEYKESAEEHRQLAEWLKELKQLKEQERWIPVSERLPEKNIEILVTTEWGEVTIAKRFYNGDWFIREDASNANTDDIVAWMPLPQPYEAESENT